MRIVRCAFYKLGIPLLVGRWQRRWQLVYRVYLLFTSDGGNGSR